MKTSRIATHKGSIPWTPSGVPLPVPEVHELFDEEAERLWGAAQLNQYLDPKERAFAPTAPAPLSRK